MKLLKSLSCYGKKILHIYILWINWFGRSSFIRSWVCAKMCKSVILHFISPKSSAFQLCWYPLGMFFFYTHSYRAHHPKLNPIEGTCPFVNDRKCLRSHYCLKQLNVLIKMPHNPKAVTIIGSKKESRWMSTRNRSMVLQSVILELHNKGSKKHGGDIWYCVPHPLMLFIYLLLFVYIFFFGGRHVCLPLWLTIMDSIPV